MRLVLCDARRAFLDVTRAALTARGHTVLADIQDPDELPALLDALPVDAPAEACVLDTSYDGTLRMDALVPVFLARDRPRLVVLSDTAPVPVWRALDDGVVHALVSKTATHDELDGALRSAPTGRRVVVGHPEPPVPADPHPRLSALTDLERHVLDLLVREEPTRAIARSLGISCGSARALVTSLLERLLGVEPATGSADEPPS